MAAGELPNYGLRKRRKLQADDDDATLLSLLEVAGSSQRIVVFSGSGLSASSGMSTFSTRGGLYERAAKKYKLSDGKMLFTYAFFDRQRPEAQAFFADIYSEAVRAEPAPGHHALRQLFDAGRLHRHYTMNIDGLAEQVGMDTWHQEGNRSGVTVEMHGNVRHLVCPECHATLPVTAALAQQIRAKVAVPCGAPGCGHPALRFKVMMYDDGEAECITPDEVMEVMEGDVKAADLVLWVGISFQQSASTLYFRKVRGWIQEAGRLGNTVQALVNPSDEALFNLRTAMSNQAELRVLEVLAEADEALPLLADRLCLPANGGGARRSAPGRPARGGAKQQDAAVASAGAALQAQPLQRRQVGAATPQLPPALPQQQRPGGSPAWAAQSVLQAVAFPATANGQQSAQQHQATVQTLESLSHALLRAMQAAGGAARQQQPPPQQQQAQQQQAWQPPPPQQQQPVWQQPLQLQPPQPHLQPDLLRTLVQALGGLQQAAAAAAPGLAMLPLLLQQQQAMAAAAMVAAAAAAQQSPRPSPSSAAHAAGVPPLGGAAPTKQPSSPRAVAQLQGQDSHNSDQNLLPTGQATPPPGAPAGPS